MKYNKHEKITRFVLFVEFIFGIFFFSRQFWFSQSTNLDDDGVRRVGNKFVKRRTIVFEYLLVRLPTRANYTHIAQCLLSDNVRRMCNNNNILSSTDGRHVLHVINFSLLYNLHSNTVSPVTRLSSKRVVKVLWLFA